MKIIDDYRLTEFFRKPKSKKKRIVKKWNKNPDNHRPFLSHGFIINGGDTMICHPTLARKMREIERKAVRSIETAPITLGVFSTPTNTEIYNSIAKARRLGINNNNNKGLVLVSTQR